MKNIKKMSDEQLLEYKKELERKKDDAYIKGSRPIWKVQSEILKRYKAKKLAKGLCISVAVGYTRRNTPIRRAEWPKGFYIRLAENSRLDAPACFVRNIGLVPYHLTLVDIVAEDWEILSELPKDS